MSASLSRLRLLRTRLDSHFKEIGAEARYVPDAEWAATALDDPTNLYFPSGWIPIIVRDGNAYGQFCLERMVGLTAKFDDSDYGAFCDVVQYISDIHAQHFEKDPHSRTDISDQTLSDSAPGSWALWRRVQLLALDDPFRAGGFALAADETDASLCPPHIPAQMLLPEPHRSVPSGSSLADALRLMDDLGLTGVPIVAEHDIFIGVLSFGSLARWILASPRPVDAQREVVDDFMEDMELLSPSADIDGPVAEKVLTQGGVCIGNEGHVIGVLTPVDLARHTFYSGRPFSLIGQIELVLRTLVGYALGDGGTAAIEIALQKRCKAEGRELPTSLEKLTLGELIDVLSHTKNWSTVGNVVGGSRERTRRRLSAVRDARNALFHFRIEADEVDLAELENLKALLVRRLNAIPPSPHLGGS